MSYAAISGAIANYNFKVIDYEVHQLRYQWSQIIFII